MYASFVFQSLHSFYQSGFHKFVSLVLHPNRNLLALSLLKAFHLPSIAFQFQTCPYSSSLLIKQLISLPMSSDEESEIWSIKYLSIHRCHLTCCMFFSISNLHCLFSRKRHQMCSYYSTQITMKRFVFPMYPPIFILRLGVFTVESKIFLSD